MSDRTLYYLTRLHAPLPLSRWGCRTPPVRAPAELAPLSSAVSSWGDSPITVGTVVCRRSARRCHSAQQPGPLRWMVSHAPSQWTIWYVRHAATLLLYQLMATVTDWRIVEQRASLTFGGFDKKVLLLSEHCTIWSRADNKGQFPRLL